MAHGDTNECEGKASEESVHSGLRAVEASLSLSRLCVPDADAPKKIQQADVLSGERAALSYERLRFYQFRSCRTPWACLLLTMNSWSFVSVSSHLWLLSALIFRT